MPESCGNLDWKTLLDLMSASVCLLCSCPYLCLSRLSGSWTCLSVVNLTREAQAAAEEAQGLVGWGQEALAGSADGVGNGSAFSVCSLVLPSVAPSSASLACIGNGEFQYPMLHPMFLVCKDVPECVFEGESFLHAKTNCIFANLKFVVKALIPRR